MYNNMYNKFYINNNLIIKNICTFASSDDSKGYRTQLGERT